MEEVKIIDIPVSKIQANTGQIPGLPANPRKIDASQFEKLKRSLLDNPEMLKLRELLVYPWEGYYVLIGGNQRFAALCALGYTACRCKVIPEEHPVPIAKLKAYIIKDNAAFGQWDADMLHLDWDETQLVDWGIDEFVLKEFDEMVSVEDKEAEEDGYGDEETEEADTRSKRGDIWQCGEHRVMCGDSTKEEDVKALMDGEQADLLLTDPPYNVAIGDKNAMLTRSEAYAGRKRSGRNLQALTNDKLSGSDFVEFLGDAMYNANAVMRPGAAYYVWYATVQYQDFMSGLAHGNLLPVRTTLIWVKSRFVLGRQDYQHIYEPCFYGWKEGAHYFTPKRNLCTVLETPVIVDKMKKEEMRAMLKDMLSEENTPQDIIHEGSPVKSELHPTMKPVKLFGRLINNSSIIGWRVLDLFGGSGTTMVACEQLGRKAYLMEYEPRYVDVILDRYERLTGDKPTLIHRADE